MEHSPWADSLKMLFGGKIPSPSPPSPSKPRSRYGRTRAQYQADLFRACYEKYRRILEGVPPMNSTEIAERLHTNRQNVNVTYSKMLAPRGIVERKLVRRGKIYTYLWIWKGIQE